MNMKKSTALLILFTVLTCGFFLWEGVHAFYRYQDYRVLSAPDPAIWNYERMAKIYHGILRRENGFYHQEALFNFANLDFKAGLKERRIELIHAAIGEYKALLREDPSYAPAKKNLEIALRFSNMLNELARLTPFAKGFPSLGNGIPKDGFDDSEPGDKPGMAPYEPSIP